MFSKRQDQASGDAQSGGGETAAQTQTSTAPAAPAAPASAKSAGRSGLGFSVIQSDLVIKGAILARGELELHGLVEGDVIARSVVIGPTATIQGDILGEKVSIFGEVRGQVSGHHVHLGAGARYVGDIRQGGLAIDDGAEFEGAVRPLGDEGRTEIAARLEGAAPEPSSLRAALMSAAPDAISEPKPVRAEASGPPASAAASARLRETGVPARR